MRKKKNDKKNKKQKTKNKIQIHVISYFIDLFFCFNLFCFVLLGNDSKKAGGGHNDHTSIHSCPPTEHSLDSLQKKLSVTDELDLTELRKKTHKRRMTESKGDELFAKQLNFDKSNIDEIENELAQEEREDVLLFKERDAAIDKLETNKKKQEKIIEKRLRLSQQLLQDHIDAINEKDDAFHNEMKIEEFEVFHKQNNNDNNNNDNDSNHSNDNDNDNDNDNSNDNQNDMDESNESEEKSNDDANNGINITQHTLFFVSLLFTLVWLFVYVCVCVLYVKKLSTLF